MSQCMKDKGFAILLKNKSGCDCIFFNTNRKIQSVDLGISMFDFVYLNLMTFEIQSN